jgi:hypothetical protein
MNDDERTEFIRIRKEAGLKIDPETAEVEWDYRQVVDPYGIYPAISENDESYCVGRAYFARAPGSETWVEFGDLPAATREALWGRHSSKLTFPAGLEGLEELEEAAPDAAISEEGAAAWLSNRAQLCADDHLDHVRLGHREAEQLIAILNDAKWRKRNQAGRHIVEIPDQFAVARWSRDADVATIARCILGTLKYEPHATNTDPLRRALESVADAAMAQQEVGAG